MEPEGESGFSPAAQKRRPLPCPASSSLWCHQKPQGNSNKMLLAPPPARPSQAGISGGLVRSWNAHVCPAILRIRSLRCPQKLGTGHKCQEDFAFPGDLRGHTNDLISLLFCFQDSQSQIWYTICPYIHIFTSLQSDILFLIHVFPDCEFLLCIL